MKIISIDVGVVNLGLVSATLRDDFTHLNVTLLKRIDLTDTEGLHHRIPRNECKLHHTADACDRVAHLVQEYQHLFDEADVILIERQPITGLVHCEQLLYHHFRQKALLCSPRTIHKHFNIGDLNYEQRKEHSVFIAEDHVKHLSSWKELGDRRHDVSDAVCMILWWMSLQQQKQRRISAEETFHSHSRSPLASGLSLSVPPLSSDCRSISRHEEHNAETETKQRNNVTLETSSADVPAVDESGSAGASFSQFLEQFRFQKKGSNTRK